MHILSAVHGEGGRFVALWVAPINTGNRENAAETFASLKTLKIAYEKGNKLKFQILHTLLLLGCATPAMAQTSVSMFLQSLLYDAANQSLYVRQIENDKRCGFTTSHKQFPQLDFDALIAKRPYSIPDFETKVTTVVTHRDRNNQAFAPTWIERPEGKLWVDVLAWRPQGVTDRVIWTFAPLEGIP